MHALRVAVARSLALRPGARVFQAHRASAPSHLLARAASGTGPQNGPADSSQGPDLPALLNSFKQELGSNKQELLEQLGSRDTGFTGIQQEFGSILDLLDRMDQHVGPLVAQGVRTRLSRELGTGYVGSLHATSLLDVALHLFSGEGDTRNVSEAMERIATRLVQEDVPRRLLHAVDHKRKAAGGDMDWTQLDKDTAFRASRMVLVDMLEMPESEQIKALQLPDGAGMMCLLAAAQPTWYLSSGNGAGPDFPLLPDRTLELGVSGRASVYSKHAAIDLGEIMDDPDFESALPQLALRLKALEYAARAWNPQLQAASLVGRVVLPRTGVNRRYSDPSTWASEKERAASEHGFTLRVHVV